MFVIAVANHKGGTGKTTTTHTLGHILAAERGLRTLLIDLDPQGSLTLACGVPREWAENHNVSHMLQRGKRARSLGELAFQVGPRCDLVPSHKEQLAECQRELAVRMVGRDTALRMALRHQADAYSVVLVDCMPGFDILSINALVAATHVLVPLKPTIMDIGGLGEFLDTLDVVEEMNPDLVRLGILVTFYHPQYNLHRQGLEMLGTSLHGFPVLQAKIGESVKVAEAPGLGRTVVEHDGDNRRAEEYRALADEVLRLLGDGRGGT